MFIIKLFAGDLTTQFKDISLTLMDLTKIIYSIIIIVWAHLFLKTWRQKEKLYAYFWGTETFALEEPYDDQFIYDYQTNFLFNFKILTQSRLKKYFKIFISYCIVAMFVRNILILEFNSCWVAFIIILVEVTNDKK